MNCKKCMMRYSIVLSIVLTVGSIFCVPTPSTARIVTNDVLSIQLAQAEEPVVIHSNLLTEEGQTVLLNGDFTEMEIPITVSGGDLVTAENTEEKAGENEEVDVDEEAGKSVAVITAVSSDTTRLEAELDTQELELQTKGGTIQLILRRVEPSEEEPPTDDDVSGNDTETDEVSDGDAELYVEVTLVYKEHSFSVTFVLVQSKEDDTEKETSEDEAFGKEAVSGGDAGSSEVTGGDASAGGTADGELAFCQSQYHPTEQILVVNGDEQDCELGGFPAMTRYILDEKTYLLYQGGSITLPAGKAIYIDLSQTGYKENLLLKSGGDNTYTIEYVELPQIPSESYPLIIGIGKKELPIDFIWGKIEPTIVVEQLTVENPAAEEKMLTADEEAEEETLTAVKNTLIWKESESITFEKDDEGKLHIVPDRAEAGTYRMIVSWIENEITLYQMEVPFFVQYKSGDLGGSGQ